MMLGYAKYVHTVEDADFYRLGISALVGHAEETGVVLAQSYRKLQCLRVNHLPCVDLIDEGCNDHLAMRFPEFLGDKGTPQVMGGNAPAKPFGDGFKPGCNSKACPCPASGVLENRPLWMLGRKPLQYFYGLVIQVNRVAVELHRLAVKMLGLDQQDVLALTAGVPDKFNDVLERVAIGKAIADLGVFGIGNNQPAFHVFSVS